MTVGILAIQGSVQEHACAVEKLGARVVFVRAPRDMECIDALILPGGESTNHLRILSDCGLDAQILESARSGMPMYGTCAGMIVLKKLGLLDVELTRNGYGSQLNSFEDEVVVRDADELGAQTLHGVFIRAPKISSVGNGVQILAVHDGTPVLVRQGGLLASSFHPELTDSAVIHRFFLNFHTARASR